MRWNANQSANRRRNAVESTGVGQRSGGRRNVYGGTAVRRWWWDKENWEDRKGEGTGS